MKNLKIQVVFFMLGSFLFVNQTNAQVITNNTDCEYTVKANYVQFAGCVFNGGGPLVTIAPHATMVLPPPMPGDWIPGYGVNLTGLPPRVVTATSCPGPVNRILGYCGNVLAVATYVAGGDLDIN